MKRLLLTLILFSSYFAYAEDDYVVRSAREADVLLESKKPAVLCGFGEYQNPAAASVQLNQIIGALSTPIASASAPGYIAYGHQDGLISVCVTVTRN